MSRDDRNVSGQAYALTVLAPITSGRSSELAGYLDRLPGGDASPIARVGSTHFARWVVIDSLVYEGGRQRRDTWSGPRLLFTSNFDGPLDPYLERLRTSLASTADEIWGHCAGYPGHDSSHFGAWIRGNQLTTSLFFAAYGDKTVEQVRRDLAVRQWLIGLVGRAPSLTAAELQAEFVNGLPA